MRDDTSEPFRGAAYIPRTALYLGYGGVLPFAAGAILLWAARDPVFSVQVKDVLLFYGAIILSFMGGARWGLASQTDKYDALPLSVVPALIAWFALWPFGFLGITLTDPVRIILLLAAFIALLLWDLKATRTGDAPGWYGPLRVRLTFYVSLFLIAALIRLSLP